MEWIEKIGVFRLISRFISKTIQDAVILKLNRKTIGSLMLSIE